LGLSVLLVPGAAATCCGVSRHDRSEDMTVCCEPHGILTARSMSLLLEGYRTVDVWAGMDAAPSI
jgi:hypothetical protein